LTKAGNQRYLRLLGKFPSYPAAGTQVKTVPNNKRPRRARKKPGIAREIEVEVRKK
jgi:hypothetical protein